MNKKMTRGEWLKTAASSLASLAAMAAIPSSALNLTACKESGKPARAAETAGKASTVWMTRDITPEAFVKIYEALGREATGKVAVKISTGEPGGHNFLQPSLIKDLVQKVKGTIVECNTAYEGRRFRTEDHLKAIREHGFFDIADVDIMDAEGDIQIPVRDKRHIQYDIVGKHLKNYDFMINLAHFKGHAMAGFGGVIKNQSIGVASTAGKAYIHSGGATTDTVEMWNHMGDQDAFLESMASAAQGVADVFGENILYINVMNRLSVDCDCDSHPHDPQMKDIGILASTDPVALDKACLDLVFNAKPSEGDDNRPLTERIESRSGKHTVEYAAQIGLGSLQYEIKEL